MRTILFLLLLSACAVPPTQERQKAPVPTRDSLRSKMGPDEGKMVLKGYYTGKNIYVQNPLTDQGGFCVTSAPEVNGSVTTRLIHSSAFEIDLGQYHLKIGDPVEIVITHHSGCAPKILNPEALAQTLPHDSLPGFFSRLRDWESYWKKKFPAFALSKFYAASVSRISNGEETDWTDTFSGARKSAINFFSPDSAFFAEIYTYRWSLEVKDKKIYLEGGEPESQVSLTSIKTKKTTYPCMCGSSCYFEDLVWLGPEEFALLGHEEAEGALYQGFIERVDLGTNECTVYVSRDFQAVHPADYIKYRLTGLLGVDVH
jgi:hypothetical protein